MKISIQCKNIYSFLKLKIIYKNLPICGTSYSLSPLGDLNRSCEFPESMFGIWCGWYSEKSELWCSAATKRFCQAKAACGLLNESLSRWCDWGAATTTAHKQAQKAHMSLLPFLLRLSSRHVTTSVKYPYQNAHLSSCVRWDTNFELLSLVARRWLCDASRSFMIRGRCETEYWVIQPGDGKLELEQRVGSLRSGWERYDTPTLVD